MDEDGCVMSPNYPENYGPNEKCEIALTVDTTLAGKIKVKDFSTYSCGRECGGILRMNGRQFSGVEGPNGLIPKGPLQWTSSKHVHTRNKGWKLCPARPEDFATHGETKKKDGHPVLDVAYDKLQNM